MRPKHIAVLALMVGLLTPVFAEDSMNANSGGTANANSGYATDHSNGSTNAADSTGAPQKPVTKHGHKKHKKQAAGTNAPAEDSTAPAPHS